MGAKTVEDLKPNPKNPRKVTDAKLQQLKKAMLEFGDLGGFVFNRKTGNLVGGHQRQKAFDPKAPIKIESNYARPTRTGTVAEGYVVLDGERFRFREVVWDEAKEKAATIAANKSAGEWDLPILSEWLTDLDDFGFDLDTTMFDALERKKLMPDLSESGTEDDQGKLDKKSRSASDDIGSIQLTFTENSLTEFKSLLDHFQKKINIDSISDLVLEVFRRAKDRGVA